MEVEVVQRAGHGLAIWPLSIAAYHALGDLGLIPELAVTLDALFRT